MFKEQVQKKTGFFQSTGMKHQVWLGTPRIGAPGLHEMNMTKPADSATLGTFNHPETHLLNGQKKDPVDQPQSRVS